MFQVRHPYAQISIDQWSWLSVPCIFAVFPWSRLIMLFHEVAGEIRSVLRDMNCWGKFSCYFWSLSWGGCIWDSKYSRFSSTASPFNECSQVKFLFPFLVDSNVRAEIKFCFRFMLILIWLWLKWFYNKIFKNPRRFSKTARRRKWWNSVAKCGDSEPVSLSPKCRHNLQAFVGFPADSQPAKLPALCRQFRRHFVSYWGCTLSADCRRLLRRFVNTSAGE